MLVVTFWSLSAFGLGMPGFPLAALAFLSMGILFSSQAVAHSRLSMACYPAKDYTMASALTQVSIAIGAGGGAVSFGFILEWVHEKFPAEPAGVSWGYLTIWTTMILLTLATQWALTRIPEEGRVPTRVVLVQAMYGFPLRALSSFLVEGRRKR